MKDPLTALVIANAIIWIGFGAYLGFLGLSQKKLLKRCKQLEILINEKEE